MGIVVEFHHARASSRGLPSNSSTGMPVASLSRIASGKEAVFRLAARFRKCDGEHPTRSASAETSGSLMNGSSGCASGMARIISIGNRQSQAQKFPLEIRALSFRAVKSAMPNRTFLLGEWIDALAGGVRLVRGYQTGMAARLGITQGQVSNMISGRKTPQNAELLLDLSDLMGVSVNDLFKIPPPEAQMERIRPYSPFVAHYVSRPGKTVLPPPKPVAPIPRRRA